MNLERFKHHRLLEKSTQYYYFSDEMLGAVKQHKDIADFIKGWTGSEQDLEKEIRSKFQQHFTEAEEPDTNEPEKSTVSLVPGTLVLIKSYGSDDEPRKYMWNKSRGEIVAKNPNGTFKIRITDVKDSNVLFSKKWYDQEQKALTQKLNIPREAFQTLKEIEDAENAAVEKAEKEKAKVAKEKEAEKKKKEDEKKESIKRTTRRLI